MLNSIVGTNKSRQASEKAAALIVSVCAAFSIVAVVAITAYMIYSGTPALAKVGIGNILFKTEWVPSQGKFGILYINFYCWYFTCSLNRNPCWFIYRSRIK